MKFVPFFILFIVFAAGCKKETTQDLAPFPSKTNPNLIHFGYTLVDVGWDDPKDKDSKTNYIDEVASFTNIADILVIDPTDDIRARIDLMQSNDVKAILHINDVFFKAVGKVSEFSGVDYDLRSDYVSRWDSFIALNEIGSNQEKIGAFYLGEEPTWNSISPEDFKLASDYIKTTVPTVPILLIEAYPAIEDLIIPSSVDWIGFDHYFISNPQTNEDFQNELSILKSKLVDDQKLILVLDAHYIPFAHGSSGIGKQDMDVVARNYYNLANTEMDVIGMIGYHWPSGFEFGSAIGTRGMPTNVLEEHKKIGKAITGK